MAGHTTAPDNAQIETRLLVVAEMLEKAVAEVRRAMAEIKSGEGSTTPPDPCPPPDQPDGMRGKDGNQ